MTISIDVMWGNIATRASCWQTRYSSGHCLCSIYIYVASLVIRSPGMFPIKLSNRMSCFYYSAGSGVPRFLTCAWYPFYTNDNYTSKCFTVIHIDVHVTAKTNIPGYILTISITLEYLNEVTSIIHYYHFCEVTVPQIAGLGYFGND